MMNNRLVILISLIIILSISSTLAFYYGIIVIKTERVDMDIIIGNKIGFNTDTDSIHFGTLFRGGEARRTVILYNENDFPITVDIGIHGDFIDWVDIEDEIRQIPPLSNSSVNFIARPPTDADFGTYIGYSTFIFKRNII